MNATLIAANKLYATRNRFIHDRLRADLLSGGWELKGLERQPDGEQNITTTTLDGMVELIKEPGCVTWRLRGADSRPERSKGNGMAARNTSGENARVDVEGIRASRRAARGRPARTRTTISRAISRSRPQPATGQDVNLQRGSRLTHRSQPPAARTLPPGRGSPCASHLPP